MFIKLINTIQLQAFVWILGALMGTTSLSVLADRETLRSTDGLPDYYPANFQKTGVIRDVTVSDTLIISGLKYRLSADTKIHSTSNQFSSRWVLKTGEEVGFTFSSDAANQRTIDEIWILPKGRVVSH